MNPLGLVDGTVSLSSHDKAWSSLFSKESQQLRATFGDAVVGVEHVGSTAIPNIRAKPILDVLVGVHDLQQHASFAPALTAIGYEFRPNAGLPSELVWVKGTPRTHILHLVEWSGAAWRQKLAFRDALLDSPALALEYENLKLNLAQEFAADRVAYTAGKTAFVKRVIASHIPEMPFLTRD